MVAYFYLQARLIGSFANSLELPHDSSGLNVPLHHFLPARGREKAGAVRGERHRGHVWETLPLSVNGEKKNKTSARK